MKRSLDWFSKRSFAVYCLAFLLMALSSVGLYFAAQAQADELILGLLALVVIGNILVLFPR